MILILIGLTEVFQLFTITSEATPWLLPIFLLLITVRQEESNSQLLAVLGGVVWEAFSGLPIGSFSLPLLFMNRVWHWFYHSISFYNFNWKQFPLVAAGTWVVLYGWLILYSSFLSRTTALLVPSVESLLHKAIPSFIATIIFSPLVYLVYLVFEILMDYLKAFGRKV